MEIIDSSPRLNLEASFTSTINGRGTILNLDLHSDTPLETQEKYVLLVLDISGSMCGNKLETSKQALSELVQMLYSKPHHPRIGLITFNQYPYFFNLSQASCNECLDTISAITGYGGTAFIPVFDMISEILCGKRIKEAQSVKKVKKTESDQLLSQPLNIKEAAVVFLSDGQAEDLQTLRPHISKLRKLAEEKLLSAEFHTLGFGVEHDARLLEEMTKSMPVQGSFQYLKVSSEIKPCIQAISNYLVEKRFSSYLKQKGSNFERKVNFAKKNDGLPNEISWRGVVCLDKTAEEFKVIEKDLTLFVKTDEGYKEFQFSAEFRKSDDKESDVIQNCLFINEELKKISDNVISGSFNAKQTEEYRDKVAGLRVMLNEILKSISQVKIEKRKYLLDMSRDLNEYINKIGDLLRSQSNRGLSNDQIASINALAYRHVTKNRNLKAIDKRAINNVDLLNQVSVKTQEIASKINEQDFAAKYKNLIEEVGCCALNLSDMTEALKGADCLCLTFDIGRPEVAIQDASRIIIKKIYPTIISASAFLDSVQHSMKLDPNNSGGFDLSFQGDIVKGASNESITAALPLYFCDEHWECASQYIKPILGWDVTIDPLGFDYNQLRTVPFLLLIKALEDQYENATEFNLKVTKWLLETCCQIIQDEINLQPESNLAKTVKRIWRFYETDGVGRGVNAVQSSQIFLAYVYCMQHMGILEKDDKEGLKRKLQFMIEEDMRRKQGKPNQWAKSQIIKNLKKLFSLDLGQYLGLLKKEEELDRMAEEPIKKKEENESLQAIERKYIQLFQRQQKIQPKKNWLMLKYEREQNNKLKASKNKEKLKDKNANFELTVPEEFVAKVKFYGLNLGNAVPQNLSDLQGYQKELALEAYKSYKYSAKPFKIWARLWGLPVDEHDKIQSIGIETPMQLFTLLIQNKLHLKDSERQNSFSENTYYSPFDPQQAEECLYKLTSQVIYELSLRESKNKPKEVNCSIEDIHLFAETKNLEVAAGILLNGFNLGSHEHLQHYLRKEASKCNKVIEKLLMIKHKEFKGVNFNFEFRIRKKFTRQLYTAYKKIYTYEQWKETWFREKPQPGDLNLH